MISLFENIATYTYVLMLWKKIEISVLSYVSTHAGQRYCWHDSLPPLLPMPNRWMVVFGEHANDKLSWW